MVRADRTHDPVAVQVGDHLQHDRRPTIVVDPVTRKGPRRILGRRFLGTLEPGEGAAFEEELGAGDIEVAVAIDVEHGRKAAEPVADGPRRGIEASGARSALEPLRLHFVVAHDVALLLADGHQILDTVPVVVHIAERGRVGELVAIAFGHFLTVR